MQQRSSEARIYACLTVFLVHLLNSYKTFRISNIESNYNVPSACKPILRLFIVRIVFYFSKTEKGFLVKRIKREQYILKYDRIGFNMRDFG
jgi:hypothetical protein